MDANTTGIRFFAECPKLELNKKHSAKPLHSAKKCKKTLGKGFFAEC
jgi:hypothetical protein